MLRNSAGFTLFRALGKQKLGDLYLMKNILFEKFIILNQDITNYIDKFVQNILFLSFSFVNAVTKSSKFYYIFSSWGSGAPRCLET